MNGRLENKIKTEQYLQNKISRYPSWLSDYYYSLANFTHNTKFTYVMKVCAFLDFYFTGSEMNPSNERIASIGSTDINIYINYSKSKIINGKEMSKSTINQQITALTNFFDFLYAQGYITKNPMDQSVGRAALRSKNEIIYLEKNEIQKLLSNVDQYKGKWKNRDRLIVILPLVTGMRVSALSEINIEDIDFQKKEIKVIEKGEKQRTFEVTEEIIDLMETWMTDREKYLAGEKQDAFFITKKNGIHMRISVRSIERMVKRYAKGIEKHITPHKLRSTFGTQFYRQTGDIYLTADMMGHESTRTTARYVAIDNKKKKEENFKYISGILHD